ncbi:sigma-70 family RNA polymerase sigma factor [Paenibacillus sp. HJL G12]|uniref:Sigma-70 family RNA polymerase sigma factor n=1 Tax=Paenibacillus dendrobii TaxID=2691084 RepID=A0A7X3IFI1_9BACL|nr:sigma-70 family RNA polymerase sigma factor [Paenibacillus dendrobii]MWV42944.1 sigma-70 family RNA polymerase sigma factor [Paenibacillus dendrobii]
MLNRKTEKLLTRCIREHKENVYRLAYSYVKNKEDALDIVQDSIYKAMTNIELLKNPEAVKSWFYRIVVNTALDFLRRNKKVHPMDHEMIEAHSAGAEDVYTDIDLKRTLDALPEKYRIVIVLRYFEDMKIDEVAAVLDENVNTIKTRLYQALQLLRVKMDDGPSKEIK